MTLSELDIADSVGEVRLPQIDFQSIEKAVKKCQGHLLNIQSPSGYWFGELEADASVTAGYLPLMYFMQGEIDKSRMKKGVNFILSKQNQDGSWSTYPGGPGDLSVSIQVYFSLKLAGISQGEQNMKLAREFILSQGGLDKANVFTKIWLAIFGQYEWRKCPSVPPEIIYFPNWFVFNIYEFASWSRATIMALSIVITKKPVCPIPEAANINELWDVSSEIDISQLDEADETSGWKKFFLTLDRFFKSWEKLPIQPGRKSALRKIESWILDHQEADGSWGGIMLPWVYSLIALKSMGYTENHPVIERGLNGLEDFILEDETSLRLQPATSPVWDTAWTVIALRESGLPGDHPSIIRAAKWMLDQEIRHAGDWKVKNPNTIPGGWAFEFVNNWYPDLDDSAVVPRALLKVQLDDQAENQKIQAIQRSTAWVLDMQSKDGGWAAFDRDNDLAVLAQVPFADFMSPLDPTCADVTAHVIEFLCDLRLGKEAVDKSIAYLKDSQEEDGSWYGRWGVNYIYGTGLTLAALEAAGEDLNQSYIMRAVAWLKAVQNEDGGWGETCDTYEHSSAKGTGTSTPSQTAWALIGLMAYEDGLSQEVSRGIDFLLNSQLDDGSWEEEEYTGTGFPKVFYLRYDLYRVYFPLLALSQYLKMLSEGVTDIRMRNDSQS